MYRALNEISINFVLPFQILNKMVCILYVLFNKWAGVFYQVCNPIKHNLLKLIKGSLQKHSTKSVSLWSLNKRFKLWEENIILQEKQATRY